MNKRRRNIISVKDKSTRKSNKKLIRCNNIAIKIKALFSSEIDHQTKEKEV